MKKAFETAILVLGTLGWWGFVYPELSLTKEYVACEQEADNAKEYDLDDYFIKKTCMKSYVVEYICQIRDSGKEDIEDD